MSGEPLKVSISIIEKDLADTLHVFSDSAGFFSAQLISGKAYVFEVEAPGYLFSEIIIDTLNDSNSEIDISLYKLKIHRCYLFRGVFFDFNSATPKSFEELQEVSSLLSMNPDISVTLTGMANLKEKNPKKLADKRAKKVRGYLIANGVQYKSLDLNNGQVLDKKVNTGKRHLNQQVDFYFH